MKPVTKFLSRVLPCKTMLAPTPPELVQLFPFKTSRISVPLLCPACCWHTIAGLCSIPHGGHLQRISETSNLGAVFLRKSQLEDVKPSRCLVARAVLFAFQ